MEHCNIDNSNDLFEAFFQALIHTNYPAVKYLFPLVYQESYDNNILGVINPMFAHWRRDRPSSDFSPKTWNKIFKFIADQYLQKNQEKLFFDEQFFWQQNHKVFKKIFLAATQKTLESPQEFIDDHFSYCTVGYFGGETFPKTWTYANLRKSNLKKNCLFALKKLSPVYQVFVVSHYYPEEYDSYINEQTPPWILAREPQTRELLKKYGALTKQEYEKQQEEAEKAAKQQQEKTDAGSL